MPGLWRHQADALFELDLAMDDGHRRIAITSPTGGGKSRIMFEIIKAATGRLTLHTDRVLLREQLSKTMTEHGVQHGTIAAGVEPSGEDTQLAMMQTLVSRCVRGNRMVHPSRFVLWDEVHKMVGAGATQLRGLYGDKAIDIGFTATPLGIGNRYDHLIVAGTNTELREAGHIVPAYHWGPDEPDVKWVGKVLVESGECGIPNRKRMEYTHRVFSSVARNLEIYNPERRPTILSAPGVEESIWMAEELRRHGYKTAHIDSKSVVIRGRHYEKTQSLIDVIKYDLEIGKLDIVCNRFVLREGIDWPFISHGVFATIFGSLTSYLQTGGRLLRACKGKDRATVQDHGGNWWRHGSLNDDQEWQLILTDAIAQNLRAERIRSKKEPEPICCPKCDAYRTHGATCPECRFFYRGKSRKILQRDGSLREMHGDIFKQKRLIARDSNNEKAWCARVRGAMSSKNPRVNQMTISQLEARYAMKNNWMFPHRDWAYMPVDAINFFLPVSDAKLRI
jgi:superfamily II DNA or RNA helicase